MAAYEAKQKKGEIPADRDIKFVAFGGDGGTYDIGFQALSGALERGTNFLYVCYEQRRLYEYRCAALQRHTAWFQYHHESAGDVIAGKQEYRKNLTRIVVAHGVP